MKWKDCRFLDQKLEFCENEIWTNRIIEACEKCASSWNLLYVVQTIRERGSRASIIFLLVPLIFILHFVCYTILSHIKTFFKRKLAFNVSKFEHFSKFLRDLTYGSAPNESHWQNCHYVKCLEAKYGVFFSWRDWRKLTFANNMKT